MQDNPHAFLGEEFLTWLWYRIETDGGEFNLGKDGDNDSIVGLVLDDFIAFAAKDDDETQQTLRHGLPSRSAEAATALRNGRRLTRAKFTLAQDDDMWSFTLDGPSMALLSVKLPEDDEDASSPEERNGDRMQNFMGLKSLINGLYRLFLQERLQPEYLHTGAEQQANWMAGR